MLNVDEFESHRSGAFHAVFVSTRRAKPTVTVERDIFKVATMGAMIHGTAKGRIPTMDHLFDIFHFGVSGMESIFYFFIMVCKNFLKDVHKTIMQEKARKRNPHPSRMRGRGVE